MVMKTTHRLRNLLYEGRLSAYYFGGLFSSGRSSVPHPNFGRRWRPNGVLKSGSYFPFGRTKPLVRGSQPSYPLFLLKAELDEVAERAAADRQKAIPKGKNAKLVAALREFDHLPNRASAVQGRSARLARNFNPYQHHRRSFARGGSASATSARDAAQISTPINRGNNRVDNRGAIF